MQQSLKVSFADKYPDRVPIVLQIIEKSKLKFQDGSKIKKYLVSKSDHFYHFLQTIRNTLKLQKHESLYLFVNNSGLVKAESQVGDIYLKYQSEDGYLRIYLTEYPTFGNIYMS